GATVAAGETIMIIAGALAPILTAERTALNFMQRLCGIATLTAAFVERAGTSDLKILDTRKTTPTLRLLEKYAVRCGGGVNHRMGLYDMILIKDNHRRLWRACGGVSAAIRGARRRYPALPIEIEVEDLDELREALAAGPDWIMLDNMSPPLMRECVAVVGGRCRLEASGGINLSMISEIAETGVDAVSLGCLTHSAPSVDLSLEIVEE
ncbi:MAG: carboxylating nicotinate-nucleotide diphosphorylase, partial [Kiritimatiellia bacterium]